MKEVIIARHSYVKGWLFTNKLTLIDSKTEVMHVTFRFTPTEPINSIYFGDKIKQTNKTKQNKTKSPFDYARNLGVIFEKHMSMTAPYVPLD